MKKIHSPEFYSNNLNIRSILIQFFVLGIYILSLQACTQDRDVKESPRTYLKPMKENLKPLLSELKNPLLEKTSSACELVSKYSVKNLTSQDLQFSFLRLDKTKSAYIFLDPAKNPLIQLILNKEFKVPTSEEFMALIKALSEKGQFPQDQYNQIENVYKTKGSQSPQFKTILAQFLMAKMSAQFPGIFGDSSLFGPSFPVLLLNKIWPQKIFQDPTSILNKYDQPLLLFEAKTWHEFSNELVTSLAAASQTLYDQENNSEQKYCALLLYQRFFAQLLTVKGYIGSELQIQNDGRSNYSSLTAENLQIKKKIINGSFLRENKFTHLDEINDLAGYDPQKSMLRLGPLPFNTLIKHEEVSLSERLHFLQAMNTAFEATSNWYSLVQKSKINFIGALSDIQSPAILPDEVHQLSIGFLNIVFTNLLAQKNIELISDRGISIHKDIRLKDLEQSQKIAKATGILIGQTLPEEKILINLNEITQMINLLVSMERNLNQLEHILPKRCNLKLKQLVKQEAASNTVLISKSNDTKTTEEEICEIAIKNSTHLDYKILKKLILGPDSMLSQLNKMNFPMVLLAKGLLNSDGQCISSLIWDLETGLKTPKAVCNNEEKIAAKNAINQMASHTKSPLILVK